MLRLRDGPRERRRLFRLMERLRSRLKSRAEASVSGDFAQLSLIMIYRSLSPNLVLFALMFWTPGAAFALAEEHWHCGEPIYQRALLVKDIPYQSGPDSQKLDIHVPSEVDGPYKTVMLIHG